MERVLSVTSAARRRSIMSQHSQNNLQNILQTARAGASPPPAADDSHSKDDYSNSEEKMKTQGRRKSASLGPVRRYVLLTSLSLSLNSLSFLLLLLLSSSLFKEILPMLTAPRRSSTSKISPEFVLQSLSGEDEFTNSDVKKKKKRLSLSSKSNSAKTTPYVLPGSLMFLASHTSTCCSLTSSLSSLCRFGSSGC
jgi:hypothetical protein